LIATDGPNAFQVLQKILFPVATNGIEQCQWDGTIGTNGRFLLNVPEVNGPGDDTKAGGVFTIDPNPLFISMTPATTTPDPADPMTKGNVDITQCAGPQGMAIGPRPGDDVLLGCNAPVIPATASVSNSVTIDKGTGLGVGPITATLQGQGGADQVWFDPIANHYSIAQGTTTDGFPQQLGIVDAGTGEGDAVIDQQIQIGFPGGTTRRSHSVAAWSGSPLGLPPTSVVFLPVSATGGGTPGFSSTVCGAMAAQGCIAVFGTTPIPNPDAD
jgi:hypothetical protein